MLVKLSLNNLIDHIWFSCHNGHLPMVYLKLMYLRYNPTKYSKMLWKTLVFRWHRGHKAAREFEKISLEILLQIII